jgi:hypothetical protein
MAFGSTGYSWAAEGAMGSGASCPVDFAYSLTQPPLISNYSDGGFIGATVLDRNDHDLGKVVDVTAGPNGGVNFLIIYSCLPGMTQKLVAYPVREFDTDQPVGTLVINANREEFQHAPTIESNLWPSGVGTRWVGESYRYFENTF